MARVLFTNPPWWDGQEMGLWRGGVRAGSRWPFTLLMQSKPDQFVFGDYLPYPFFMGYAATYVAKYAGVDAVMRDSIALRESYDSWRRYISTFPFTHIFIESATPSWDHDVQRIKEIHQLQPTAKIVVCGPITTIKADEILSTLPVHACIKGEYEKGAARVIGGEHGVIDFDLLSEEEMNAAPFPYFDEVIAHRYWDVNPRGQVPPHAQVWSSRGCPYKCIFCVWPATMTGNDPDGTQRRTVRHYRADYMERFLTNLINTYGYKCIYFDDDTFNLGNRHVVDMCGVMKRLGIPWSAMCRADTSKMETWELMRDSGCFGVKLGFESGNQYVVDKIVNKHLDLNYAKDVVHELKRLGMTVHGTFTFGLPGETREQMVDTLDFIKSLPFDSVQTSGTAEIEGTPLHTLRTRGKLEKYEGAEIAEGTAVWTDGNKRWVDLAEQLRNS